MSGRRIAIVLLVASWVVGAFASPAAAHAERHSHVLTVGWFQGRPHLVLRHHEHGTAAHDDTSRQSRASADDHGHHTDHVFHSLVPVPILAPQVESRLDGTWVDVVASATTDPAIWRPARLLSPPPPRRSDGIVLLRTTVLVV